jgi:hypothetical protein
MDPYLDKPSRWPDVHHGIISECRAALNRLLQPRYVVRVEERVYIASEDDPARKEVIPDVQATEGPGAEGEAVSFAGPHAALIAEPVVLTTVLDEEIHEYYLRVVNVEDQSVVTFIEVLNPSNKTTGSAGREAYVEKRREVLRSGSHLVEIDLLRRGNSFIPRRGRIRGADYTVHVSRTDLRPRGRVWPIRLQQPLPVVGIPLKKGDPDAPLDLQEVLTSAYDRAAYGADTDYRADPVPPLAPEQAAWAEDLLKSKGLR